MRQPQQIPKFERNQRLPYRKGSLCFCGDQKRAYIAVMTLTDSGTSLVDGMAELVLAEAAACEANRTMTPAVV